VETAVLNECSNFFVYIPFHFAVKVDKTRFDEKRNNCGSETQP